VKTLPEDVIGARPTLNLGYAWALLNSGELEAAEPRLRDVERWLESNENPTLAAELAAARVYLSQSLGDAPGTLEHAQRALDLAGQGDDAARVTGTALLALALWGRGDLEAAHRTFSEALSLMRKAGHVADAIRGIFVLGDIRVAQGCLREAARIYEQGLQLAAETVQSSPLETDELYLALSEVHREWNDIASATAFLHAMTNATSQSTSQSGVGPAHIANTWRWSTAMAGVCTARGDLEGALGLLDDAERQDRRDPIPRSRPIAAMKARVFIAQGRLDAATEWATHARLSVDDDLTFLREFEHITLARLLIAKRRGAGGERFASDAERLLERLRIAAQTGGRMGSVIEILVLQALVQQAAGNMRSGLDLLAQALVLAEPEGFLRVFLDEGTPMRDMLRHATARGLAGPYTRQVLAAFDAPQVKQTAAPVGGATRAAAGAMHDVVAMTTRELEILRLIAAGLRNQEIAEHLSISAATVKRHIANAYGKLGAGHRTEALVRAKELRLL
jgi:LuxR family maltose regulon positive regulatory protein